MFSFRFLSRAVALVCLGLPYIYGRLFFAYDGIGRTAEQIQDDFSNMASKIDVVRTYAISIQGPGYNINYIDLAMNNGLEILVGVGPKDDPQTVCNTLNKYHPNVYYGICVGNEDITNEYDDILRQITNLKGCLDQSIPITTAQQNIDWLRHSNDNNLLNQVTLIAANIYTLWDDPSSTGDADRFRNQFLQLQGAFPNKRIVVTETGWPTAGGPVRGHDTSVPKLQQYFDGVITLRNCIDMFWFMYIDVHKSDDKPYENYFGLYDQNRTPKITLNTYKNEAPPPATCPNPPPISQPQ